MVLDIFRHLWCLNLGMVCFLPWQQLPTAEQVFDPYLWSSSVGMADSFVGLSGWVFIPKQVVW